MAHIWSRLKNIEYCKILKVTTLCTLKVTSLYVSCILEVLPFLGAVIFGSHN